jgi:hypothetical protein
MSVNAIICSPSDVTAGTWSCFVTLSQLVHESITLGFGYVGDILAASSNRCQRCHSNKFCLVCGCEFYCWKEYWTPVFCDRSYRTNCALCSAFRRKFRNEFRMELRWEYEQSADNEKYVGLSCLWSLWKERKNICYCSRDWNIGHVHLR